MTLERRDDEYFVKVPKPPPCLPRPNSFDDLLARCDKLPYGYHFEALHGSHETYDWMAIIGYKYAGQGHGDPGTYGDDAVANKRIFVGVGGRPDEALKAAVKQAEAHVKAEAKRKEAEKV